MNVIVIGLGSMGKRRIGLLKDFDVCIFGIDTNLERREFAERELGIITYEKLDDIVATKGDCAFICTSPLSHNKIISTCLEKGFNVFTEINLVSDGYRENLKLAKEKELRLFLSSTFLYRPETEYIINRVKQTKSKHNYIYHIGQYLPDWHPWESYNSFFVGDKRTNGCREIFAIELPWIVTCFSDIEKVYSSKRNLSGLNLNYNDSYFIYVTHKDGTEGIIAVDVVSRKAVRKLEIYGEDIYLTWNGTPDSVFDYNIEKKQDVNINIERSEHKEGYASFIIENPYMEEIKSFFDYVNNPEANEKWDFERDLKVLKIIDEIEE